MSTEAAGEATHETVEAGREVTAVTVGADEVPGAARDADGDGRSASPLNGHRTATDKAPEPGAGGEDDTEPDRPGAGSGSANDADDADDAADAAGDADDAAPGPDGERGEGGEGGADDRAAGPDGRPGGASVDPDADDAAGEADADDADADEDPDEADWPDDDPDASPDEDDLAYDEYDYDDDYADGEEGPDDGGTGRPRRWPRVLLLTGFVLAAAAIVGGALAIVGSVTHGFKKPVKVTYKKSALFTLKTGDCFNPLGQAFTLTSCDDPHQAEVFATFALPGGKYPGSTAIAASAAQGCANRLTSYLNPQLAISLASTYVYPDATAWQAGTRTVICEVQASSGQLTGSVRGASATAG